MKKILFNDKLALESFVLDGKKTQTRRIIPINPDSTSYQVVTDELDNVVYISIDNNKRFIKPKYCPFENISIAQRYSSLEYYYSLLNSQGKLSNEKFYQWYKTWKGELKHQLIKTKGWDNKMFVKAEYMPYSIQITDIKVERLQDISKEDCFKEGIIMYDKVDGIQRYATPDRSYISPDIMDCFKFLIDKISKKGTFDSNPLCFVYEFKLN